jgi:hypothetical protein
LTCSLCKVLTISFPAFASDSSIFTSWQWFS